MSQDKQKLSYSDQELEEFRAIIEQKLKKANEQLDYCKKIVEDHAKDEKISVNTIDEPLASMNSDHIVQLAKTTQKYIDHLHKALERIDNKVYGICRQTGKLISKERLKAVPHATLSIEAKQSQKR